MSLNYTTITETFEDGSGNPLSGLVVTFTPSGAVYSSGSMVASPTTPVIGKVNGSGQLKASDGTSALALLATDNDGLIFEGLTGFFYWTVTVASSSSSQSFSFFLPGSPDTVELYALANTEAGGGGGGSGSVTSVAVESANGFAGTVANDTTDAEITLETTVTGILKGDGTGVTAATPGTDYDAAGAAATAQAAAEAASLALTGGTMSGAIAMGSHKVTGLTNGSSAQDAAAYGQIPSALPPNGSASGDLSGSYPDPTVAKVNGVAVSGTPSSGNVLTATSSSAADWAAPSGGLSAWQFTPEGYSAKGDGAFLYDANMNGSTAVLTTAGLPAPTSPTLSNSGSGGSLSSGTYQVKITYVNQYGETLPSTAGSKSISGSEPLTVPSPAPWTNATGYYVYCTQAGGSTFTRQQTPGSPTPLRTSYVLTANPSSGGAAPPASNTSNSAPFTAGDVGKSIIVLSAGGFLNVPLVTTIASYQSATQVTLSHASSSAVTGYGAVYGTDDTAAIQAAINAAVAYAQTAGSEQGTGEVVFSDKIYCVAGALAGTYQNSQLQIPFVDPYAGPKVNLKLTGPQEATGPVHWEQPNPPAGGCTIASIYYSDSGSPPVPYPVVIGAPVENASAGVYFGGDTGLFSNMRVIVDGINVLASYRPCISGLDLYGAGQADIKSFSYFGMARTGTAAGGWPAYTGGSANPAPWQVFGYRCPYTGNNAQNDVDRLTVYGAWYGFLFTDHFSAQSIKCIYAKAAAVSVSDSGSHHCYIGALTSEVTDYPVYCPEDGVYGGPATQPLTIAAMQSENAVTIIEDAGNYLYGDIHAENASLTGAFSGGKGGAANVRLIWDYQPLGVAGTPPSVPATTVALTNTFWRDALVLITSGGAAVSAIAVDGTVTGLTLSTSGTVAVPVRNGGTITLTYASTAPTWAWVLF